MASRRQASPATATAAAEHATTAALLGGRTPAAFLAQFWHKEALLVRGAVPGFTGLFTRAQLCAFAERDDVESRLVVRDGRQWSLAHGPFTRRDWKALPERDWTLLVQGANLFSDAADALLRRFAFAPYARLDDLMVSYAAPGGGVGPHFDSYDVFLLQGEGQRRWRYGRQDDLELRPGLPVKILRRFVPERDDVLGPGDLLYLPPQFAHDGVAVTACQTYSIGFRAASASELAVAFLDFLRDEVDLPGRYADPDLVPTRMPARIAPAMLRQCTRMLAGIRWDPALVARFLGCWLSEPKPHVFFEPPAPRLSRARFAAAVAGHGLTLDRRTQLLYDDRHLYINGSALPWPDDGTAALARLADERALGPRAAQALPPGAATLAYQWYCDGFLGPGRD
jgi:50S ribosomal protein L16 3-hydroxylase